MCILSPSAAKRVMLAARRRRWNAADLRMHLQPDAVYRHAARLEVADHHVDRVRLRVHPFDVVVVVEEQHVGVGGARVSERQLDVVTPDAVVPEPRRERCRRRRSASFTTSHASEFAAIVRHDVGDVIVEQRPRLGPPSSCPPSSQRGELTDARPACARAPSFRSLPQRPRIESASLVAEHAARRPQGLELHVVLGRQRR